MYGAHTATTLVPILAVFWDPLVALSTQQRQILTVVYLPYLVMPLAIMWRAIACSTMFPASSDSGKSKTK